MKPRIIKFAKSMVLFLVLYILIHYIFYGTLSFITFKSIEIILWITVTGIIWGISFYHISRLIPGHQEYYKYNEGSFFSFSAIIIIAVFSIIIYLTYLTFIGSTVNIIDFPMYFLFPGLKLFKPLKENKN